MKLNKRAFNFKPSTINEEERTVDVVWTSGASVKRYSWDGEYNEVLVVNDTSVNLARLNQGAPLLDTHSSYDLNDMVGVVERAWIDRGKGYATVRFSERAEAIWKDVKAGIIRNISVGYSIEEFEEVTTDGVRTIKATKWTPVELSLVPVPADADAQVRSADIKSEEAVLESEEVEVVEISESVEDLNNEELIEDTSKTVSYENQEEETILSDVENSVESDDGEASNDCADNEVKPEEISEGGDIEAVETSNQNIEVSSDERMVSAAIVKRCVENGVAEYAADFIEKRYSLEEVETRISSLSKIREICKRSGFEQRADEFIKARKTLEEVRGEILDLMIEQDNENINSRFAVNSALDEDAEKQKRVARSLNPMAIYKKVNSKK